MSHHPSASVAGRLSHSKKSPTGSDRSDVTFPSTALNYSFKEVASSPSPPICNSLVARRSSEKSNSCCHEIDSNVSPQISLKKSDVLSTDFAVDKKENRKWLLRTNGMSNGIHAHNCVQPIAPFQNQILQAESTRRMSVCHATKFDKTSNHAMAIGAAKKNVATSLSSTTMSNFSSSSSGKPRRRCPADYSHSSKTLDNYFDIPSTIDRKQADQYRIGALSQYRSIDRRGSAPSNDSALLSSTIGTVNS